MNNMAKLRIPQNTDPKKIKEDVSISIFILLILLKKNGDCNV